MQTDVDVGALELLLVEESEHEEEECTSLFCPRVALWMAILQEPCECLHVFCGECQQQLNRWANAPHWQCFGCNSSVGRLLHWEPLR